VAERAIRPGPGRGRDWIALACLAALGLAAWQIQAALPLNHDVGWLLLGARRLLDDGQLSADRFLDVTPPLAVGLYALPVAASRALCVSEIAAFRIFVILLAAGALALCQQALSRLLADEPPGLTRAWLVCVGILLLPLAGYDFGQREHLIALLLLPYLADAAARARDLALPRAAEIGIGAAAGLAIGMKPQYALVVLAAEAVVWHARGRRKPLLGRDLVALAGAVLLSALFTLWLAPDYLRVALPLLRETYGAYHSPRWELLRWFDLPLGSLMLLIAYRLARGSPLRALAAVLVAAALAAYAAYLAAGASWDYHRVPFGVFASATLALPLLRLLSRGAFPLVLAGAVAAASLLVAPLDLRTPRPAQTDWAGWSQGAATVEILRLVEQEGAVHSIFLFSTSLAPAFPAVNHAGVEWASRYSCLWLLPAVVRGKADPTASAARRERLDAIERRLLASVREDLARGRPELVLVPLAPQHQALGGIDLDLLAFFQRDPGFAELWSGYARRQDTPHFQVYARQP
jgi:hypothetical protein